MQPSSKISMGGRSGADLAAPTHPSTPGLVSIVIPCFNSARWLKAAIDSALLQTWPSVEVIVIDDGSNDGSVEIAQSYGSRIRFLRQSRRGAPVARNLGLVEARGQWVKFLDSDDTLERDALTRQIRFLESRGAGSLCVVGDLVRIDETDRIYEFFAGATTPEKEPAAHVVRMGPLTSQPLHGRDRLLMVGGFEPSLPRGQEFDLHYRLVLSGVRFVHHPGVVYRYRDHRDPSKITSGGAARFGEDFAVQQARRLLALARGAQQEVSPALARAIALRLWNQGRQLLREGCLSGAALSFKEARLIDPNCLSRTPWLYRALLRVSDASTAERVIQLGHKWTT